MRRAALLAALSLASSCASASTWSDLWSTREQQAQGLLAQHPADAAKLFSDPRRRAYAELAAGHYPQAASLLKPFSDATSQYNRGNALARSGQLQEALSAYDAAIKQAPQDADIRHNRDLVARALQGQKPPPQQQQQGGQGNPQNNDNNKQNQNNQGQDSQANQQPDNKAGTPQDPNKPGGGSQAQNQNQDQHQNQQQGGAQQQPNNSSQSDTQGGSQGSNTRQAQQGSSASSAGQSAGQSNAQAAAAGSNQNNTQGAGQNPSAQQGSAQSSQSQDARQAQADAAAGAQYLREHPDNKSSASSSAPVLEADAPRQGARSDPPKPPPSEASLALDQWLQRIPEDSGELLRRKFRIEYNMRHPEQDNER